MVNLRRRVNKLDEGTENCPVCNYPGLPQGGYDVAMSWEPQAPEPEYCPECGQELPNFRVYLGRK